MKRIVGIIFILGCFSIEVFSQGFTDINAGLTGTHWGDVAWGDYDADGDLDILVTGLNSQNIGVTKIYKNNGNSTFTELSGLNIPGTFVGDIAWGDYDGNGYLDLLVQGFTDAGQITTLYKNSGNDNFSDSGIPFPILVDGSVSFVDYNNDGAIDIMISGYDEIEYKAVLFKNMGDASFSEVNFQISGAIKSSYEWIDYDNDGDMDVFVTGLDFNGTLISKLYQNNGDDIFNVALYNFIGAWLGDASWGDYDNDGDLDLLLSGYTFSTERIAKIYKNNGIDGFSEIQTTGLIGVSHSSSIWGDYDADGDLDIFIAGTYEGSGSWVRVTDVFINNGTDTFTPAGFSFTNDAYWGESAWGDYDNDGDLDLICSGFDDLGGSHTKIYRNDVTASNSLPTPPENLISEVIDSEVILSWDASTDNETPSDGLSYNAYIHSENGEIIWNSNSITDIGFRQIPVLGNAQQNTSWTIKNLTEGVYLWSIQAIDHNYASSEFSSEQSFEITYVDIDENNITNNIVTLSNSPNPFTHSTRFQFYISEEGLVEIDMYNINGQLVNSLKNKYDNTGYHSLEWQAKNISGDKLTPGLYTYILKVNNKFISVNKCLLVR